MCNVFLAAVVLCLVFELSAVGAQVSSKGHCAIFDSKAKFSTSQFFSGTWYVVEGYPNRYYGPEAICQELTMSSDHKYVYINETVFDTKTSSLKSVVGSARFSRKGEPNHLVLYPGLKSLAQGADVWVVATDYNNYALLYACSSGDNSSPLADKAGSTKKSSYVKSLPQETKKKEYMYVLSRVPTLRPTLRARIVVDNIVRGGFPVSPLAPMNQMDCPFVDRATEN